MLITSKILDSCFCRNDDYRPMNENVIPVKTGIQKVLSFKIVLRIAQFRLNIFSRPYKIIGFVFFRCQEFFSSLFLKNYSNPGNFIRLNLPPSIRMKTISFLLKPSWSGGL